MIMYDYYPTVSEFELPTWVYFWMFFVFVWGILNIILFFKIWGMTNDVSEILIKLTTPVGDIMNEVNPSTKLNIGDAVYIKSKNKVSEIVAITNGEYECASMNGNFYDGVFKRSDLEKITETKQERTRDIYKRSY